MCINILFEFISLVSLYDIGRGKREMSEKRTQRDEKEREKKEDEKNMENWRSKSDFQLDRLNIQLRLSTPFDIQLKIWFLLIKLQTQQEPSINAYDASHVWCEVTFC